MMGRRPFPAAGPGQAPNAKTTNTIFMKLAGAILHLVWAGLLSGLMLWVSAPGLKWSAVWGEPFYLVLPIIAASWLTFAVGLFFGRPWAWNGSFVFTIFSLFTAVWFSMQAIALPIAQELKLDLAGVASALVVAGLLARSRHSYYSRPANPP